LKPIQFCLLGRRWQVRGHSQDSSVFAKGKADAPTVFDVDFGRYLPVTHHHKGLLRLDWLFFEKHEKKNNTRLGQMAKPGAGLTTPGFTPSIL
jgi:hypothetical protein